MHRFIAIVAGVLVVSMSPAYAISVNRAASHTRAFVEWAFGFQLDAAAVQAIRQGTQTDMSSDPSSVASTIADMDNVMAWVRKHSANEGAMLRALMQPELIAAWQGDTSASAGTAKAMVSAWRSHNDIIAEGTPPLRQSVVDAYIAMYEFTAKQAGKHVPAQIADHAGFAKRVAGQYAAAPADSQLKFNKIVPLWLSLQALWAQSTPAQQNQLRAVWRGTYKPPVVPEPTAPPRSGLSGVAGIAQKYNSEHLFVEGESEVMMSSWSNPFSSF